MSPGTNRFQCIPIHQSAVQKNHHSASRQQVKLVHSVEPSHNMPTLVLRELCMLLFDSINLETLVNLYFQSCKARSLNLEEFPIYDW